MDVTAQLLTLTQVAVAVAGFAGIIGAFQFKEGEIIRRGDAIGLAVIVNTGLMSAFYSILPLLLMNFGMDDAIVWVICSAMTCLIYAYFNFDFARRIKNFHTYRTVNKWMVYSLFFVSFGIIVMNAMNALNIVFHREIGPFYLGLVYSLGCVCYMFSRMLLRPIWRTIRKQEAEQANDAHV
jgi:hypothetical protein